MSNYTVLLIDYEPRSIDRSKRPLAAAGYRVEVATDGIAGVEAFGRLKPDLVLIEAMIPKKHGFEVCQDLKKTPQGKRTPVLITTAVYKGRKYRSQALHLYGCDDYVEKPLPDEQLVTTIAKHLGDPDLAGRLAALHGASQGATFHEAPPEPVAAPAPVLEAASPDSALAEQEILARLDAILPDSLGGPSLPSPRVMAATALALEPIPDDVPEVLLLPDDAEDSGPEAPAVAEASPPPEPAPVPQVISFEARKARSKKKKARGGKNGQSGSVAAATASEARPPVPPMVRPERERPVTLEGSVAAQPGKAGTPGWIWIAVALTVAAGLAIVYLGIGG
jgi:CheY-like chemotaxis protein